MVSVADRTRPGVTARDQHRYQVRWRNNGKQESRLFTGPEARRQADALAAIVHARHDRISVEQALDSLNRHIVTPDSPTVSVWSVTWRSRLVRPSGYTQRRYERDLEVHILPTLGGIPLVSLTRADVQTWVRTQSDSEASAKTVKNRHGVLSTMLDSAVQDGIIPTNPAKGLGPSLSSTHRDMTFLTPQEWHLLARCIPAGLMHDFALFLVATGARFGEAAAVTVDQVQTGHNLSVRIDRAWKRQADGTYKVEHPKSRRAVRQVDVPEELRHALTSRTTDRPSKALLWERAPGRRVTQSHFWRAFRAAVTAAEQLGLGKHPRVHDLRHTCASWLIDAGVSLPEIQRQLGHESIQTTVDRYGHLMPADGRVARAMQDRLAPQIRPALPQTPQPGD